MVFFYTKTLGVAEVTDSDSLAMFYVLFFTSKDLISGNQMPKTNATELFYYSND
tara:strand:+ start:381 stop:542 length:162 start_codon:yes stop_codon:yes gene_type:complete